jgi:Na+/melibiose symporter-like transporter
MTTLLARLAILFCGLIVAMAFLNLYMFIAAVALAPVLKIFLSGEQVFSVLYWTCFAAGAVTAFFVVRPVWRNVGKKSGTTKKPAEPGSVPDHDSN